VLIFQSFPFLLSLLTSDPIVLFRLPAVHGHFNSSKVGFMCLSNAWAVLRKSPGKGTEPWGKDVLQVSFSMTRADTSLIGTGSLLIAGWKRLSRVLDDGQIYFFYYCASCLYKSSEVSEHVSCSMRGMIYIRDLYRLPLLWHCWNC
jgi:hypothetical protein